MSAVKTVATTFSVGSDMPFTLQRCMKAVECVEDDDALSPSSKASFLQIIGDVKGMPAADTYMALKGDLSCAAFVSGKIHSQNSD